ncbi:MAG: hypothetical protein KatS3mg053_1250 [Candidatus Roseilinea sp.]|nr:MAG: hypothetical protein KatS3mg053_1250 [Candidatus Roseilinea sp.]
MSDGSKRITLAGGLERTTTSVAIKDDGSLIVEFYDFSADAHHALGRDVAFIMAVRADNKQHLLNCLLIEEQIDETSALNSDELLLRLMEKRFKDFFEVKAFFQNKNIPHEEICDDWA